MNLRLYSLLLLPLFTFCHLDRTVPEVNEAGLSTKQIEYNLSVLPLEAMTTGEIVFQSIDGGQSWENISHGLPAFLESADRAFAPAGELYVSTNKGLFHINNGPVTNPWEKDYSIQESISAMIQGKAGLYATSYGHGFLKQLPGTGVWMYQNQGLTDLNVRCLVETTDGAIFVGCETGIFKSTDGGISWTGIFSGATPNSFVVSGNALICGTEKGLMRSEDGGNTWVDVLTNEGPAYQTSQIDGGLICITQGRKRWQDAQTRENSNRLRASFDGGKTWERLELNLPKNLDIFDIKQAGKYLFCSCDTGIYRSADRGKTWENLGFSSDRKQMIQFAVSGTTIYAVLTVGC